MQKQPNNIANKVIKIRVKVDLGKMIFVYLHALDLSFGLILTANLHNHGVKVCTMVHGRPGHGISHFGELCSSRSPKSDESAPVLKIYSFQKRALGTVSKGRVSEHPGHPWIRLWNIV